MTKKLPGSPLVRDARGEYIATRFVISEADILAAAETIIAERFTRGTQIHSVADTKAFFRAKLVTAEHEVFAVLLLDNRHRVIAFEVLFTGTLDGASVYPREVVKRALHHNAAAVVFAHNHPSGAAEPSRADEQITRRLAEALALIDVRVLDHMVVGGIDTVSFAERGLI